MDGFYRQEWGRDKKIKSGLFQQGLLPAWEGRGCDQADFLTRADQEILDGLV